MRFSTAAWCDVTQRGIRCTARGRSEARPVSRAAPDFRESERESCQRQLSAFGLRREGLRRVVYSPYVDSSCRGARVRARRKRRRRPSAQGRRDSGSDGTRSRTRASVAPVGERAGLFRRATEPLTDFRARRCARVGLFIAAALLSDVPVSVHRLRFTNEQPVNARFVLSRLASCQSCEVAGCSSNRWLPSYGVPQPMKLKKRV